MLGRCPIHPHYTGTHGQNVRRGVNTPFSQTVPCSAMYSPVLGSPLPPFRSMWLQKTSFNLTNLTPPQNIELARRVSFTTFRHRSSSAHPFLLALLIEALRRLKTTWSCLYFYFSDSEELDPTFFRRVSASCDYRLVNDILLGPPNIISSDKPLPTRPRPPSLRQTKKLESTHNLQSRAGVKVYCDLPISH